MLPSKICSLPAELSALTLPASEFFGSTEIGEGGSTVYSHIRSCEDGSIQGQSQLPHVSVRINCSWFSLSVKWVHEKARLAQAPPLVAGTQCFAAAGPGGLAIHPFVHSSICLLVGVAEQSFPGFRGSGLPIWSLGGG